MLPIGLAAQLACIWEVSAPKIGNVHRQRDFEDSTYLDFLASAAAIAPEMELACSRPVGQTILASVHATRQVVRTNTNLGIVLLLAPLAAVPRQQPLPTGLAAGLEQLTVADSQLTYQAIRLANPSGLAHVPEQDITAEPTLPLRQIMKLSADRDLIARQYATDYQIVFEEVLPLLKPPLDRSLLYCQLTLLARHLDSLILRKCGPAEAEQARNLARSVLRGDMSWQVLDHWAGEEGHRRNPGTTADLIAAGLFVALREGNLSPFSYFS
jgi:triphosphoribosyl-dephospho-CoA synthase